MTEVWRTLALIYPAANARWGPRLLGRRTQRVMTRPERDALHAVLGRVPAAVAEWSEGNAAMDPLDIVEVRRPLASLSHTGGGLWWASPRDCRQEIFELNRDGRYDAIYVLWPSDGQVPHCGWGCTIGPSSAAGGAGFSSIPSDHWPTLATDPDPEQGYVHEWLHQVEGLYRALGVGEDQLPGLHDAHLSSCRPPSVEPFGQSYSEYHDGGARTWRPWYRDWMTGQVRRPAAGPGAGEGAGAGQSPGAGPGAGEGAGPGGGAVAGSGAGQSPGAGSGAGQTPGAGSGAGGRGCFGLTPERWALRAR